MPTGKHSKTSRDLSNVRVQLNSRKTRGRNPRILSNNELVRLQGQCESLVLKLAEEAKERRAPRALAQTPAASGKRKIPVECERMADGQDEDEVEHARGSGLVGAPTPPYRKGHEAPRTERRDAVRKGDERKAEACNTGAYCRPHSAGDASNDLRALLCNLVKEVLLEAEQEEVGAIAMEPEEEEGFEEEDDDEEGESDGVAERATTEERRSLMEQAAMLLAAVYFRI